MTHSSTFRGSCIGIAGGLFLSIDPLLIRLMRIDDPWVIVILRGLLMWSMFLLVHALVPRWRPLIGTPWPTRRNLPATVFFAIASITFINALAHGAVATVLVIISSTPFVSALLARLLFSEKVDRAMLAAATIGLGGVAVVMADAPYAGSMTANYFAMATAVAMALAFLCSSRVEGGTVGLPSLGAVAASLLVICLQLTPLDAIPALLAPTRGVWTLIEGALVMPLALGFLALSTRYVAPSHTGLFLLLETALAPFWIWSMFGERPGAQVMLGGAMIIGAVLCHFVYTNRRAALPAAAAT
ncbi:DMT family transporter [Massilia atriviolacea]|uniref:DMT family transporter n=1 Tax=Massilia atriviolacea TaxID=2495579 RepID=A0A430HFX5_9BURK|nr:DMT family transporter [Massilia atriviolacea]RSZ56415.1 DMT family transporter [Massilia atriviolacea]